MASGQKDTVIVRQVNPPGQVVAVDEDGHPLARVAVQLSNLIGLPAYSNVTVGPILIERYVRDTPEERRKAMSEMMDEAAVLMGEQRALIMEALKDA